MADPDAERAALAFRCEWHMDDVLWPSNDAAFALFDVGPVAYDEVALPPELGERLERLASWHDESLNWEYPPAPGPWRQEECDRFNAEARALFEEVRTLLADRLEVVWDMPTLVEHPDLEEYITDPGGYGKRRGISNLDKGPLF